MPTTYPVWVTAPFFEHYVTTQTARGAYKRVLSDVGANRPLDDHDLRVINETLTGTYTYTGTGPYGGYPGLPNSQDDVGGWENYPETYRAADWDADGDGLPNWWESLHGTNPASPANDFSESNADPDNNGYTRLDDYLAWMALPRVQVAAGASVDIDLSTLSRGYTTLPVRQVSMALADYPAGAVQLLGDGKTARFTAASGFSGIVRFTHSVTDSQADSMTGEIGVQVTATETQAILQIVRIDGVLYLDFTGTAGQTFTIQHSPDLSNWLNLQDLVANGATQRIAIPPQLTPSPRRFFRAIR